jgi:hypothetical protein
MFVNNSVVPQLNSVCNNRFYIFVSEELYTYQISSWANYHSYRTNNLLRADSKLDIPCCGQFSFRLENIFLRPMLRKSDPTPLDSMIHPLRCETGSSRNEHERSPNQDERSLNEHERSLYLQDDIGYPYWLGSTRFQGSMAKVLLKNGTVRESVGSHRATLTEVRPKKKWNEIRLRTLPRIMIVNTFRHRRKLPTLLISLRVVGLFSQLVVLQTLENCLSFIFGCYMRMLHPHLGVSSSGKGVTYP